MNVSCVFSQPKKTRIFVVCICIMGKLTDKREGCLKHDRHYMFVYAMLHCAVHTFLHATAFIRDNKRVHVLILRINRRLNDYEH